MEGSTTNDKFLGALSSKKMYETPSRRRHQGGKERHKKKKKKVAESPEIRREKLRERARSRRRGMSKEERQKNYASRKKVFLGMSKDAREVIREKSREWTRVSRLKNPEVKSTEDCEFQIGSNERESIIDDTAINVKDEVSLMKRTNVSVYPVVEDDVGTSGVIMCAPCEDQGSLSRFDCAVGPEEMRHSSMNSGQPCLTPDDEDGSEGGRSHSDDSDVPSSASTFHMSAADGDDQMSLVGDDETLDEDDDLEPIPLYCHNCMRAQVASHVGTAFELSFHSVNSSTVRKVGSHLRHLLCHDTDVECEYRLCMECRNYLSAMSVEFSISDKDRVSWRNTWPSFFWNLLTGMDARNGRPFVESYDPVYIWRFIPENVRDWWIPALTVGSGVVSHLMCRGVNRVRYDYFTNLVGGDGLSGVQSYFVDRTGDLQKFREDVQEMDLTRLMRQLSPARGGRPIMLPDVLCPWGCSEFCFRASNIEMGLIVQHHMRRVQLNFPCNDWYKRLYLIETSRCDYIREPSPVTSSEVEQEYDMILLHNGWRIRPQVELVVEKGLCAKVCRYHDSNSTRKRLYPHPPRKPNTNLSAEGPDELCHAQIQPRLFKTIMPCAYNTKLTMHTQESSFAGVSSASIRRTPRFRGMDPMLSEHEALSLAGRPDLNQLGDAYVREKVMSEQLFEGMRRAADELFPKHVRDKLIQGATYVGLSDSMVLQRNPKRSTVPALLKRRNGRGQMTEVTTFIQRSWSPLINFLQTEDSRGYGTPMKAIPHYQGSAEQNTMIQWALVGVIAGCKELHRAIDQKRTGFHHQQWHGHMLAHVHNHCVPHDDNNCPRGSPFKPKRSNLSVLRLIEKELPDALRDGTDDDEYVNRYQFNTDYWRQLFRQEDFPTISVNGSYEEAVSPSSDVSDDTDIVIIVGQVKPREDLCQMSKPGHITIRDKEYEARVISCIEAHGTSPNSYHADRFMRHGGGFSGWWLQRRMVRAPSLVTEYDRSRHSRNRDFPDLRDDYFYYVTVYVETAKADAEKYKLDFHKSLGGQTHVFCGCTTDPFPLITTARRKTSKRICMTVDCDKREHYICSVPSCETRICKRCFDTHPLYTRSVLSPQSRGTDGDGSQYGTSGVQPDDDYDSANDEDYNSDDNSSVGSSYSFADDGSVSVHDDDLDDEGSNENNDEGSGGSDTARELISDGDYDELSGGRSNVDNDNTIYEDEEIENFDREESVSLRDRVMQVQNRMRSNNSGDDRCGQLACERDVGDFVLDNFLTGSNVNPSDCPGNNDHGNRDDVPMTNAGDHQQPVFMGENTEHYPCHVLFNQAGSVCTRYNKRIKGTLAQQNFIQRLVSTIAGFSVPLLYLMATCFPRHFWSSSTKDPCAILGSAPLSCYNDCTHPNGFASTLSIARNLATHASSSSSTDPTLMGYLYDIQANKAAGGLDSRLISRRGFVVDVKSKNGINLRDSDSKATLTDSVDSHQAALDLAGSQDYEQFDLFLTFTCNHSEHPGIKHLHAHKESHKWCRNVPGYYDMNSSDRESIKRSLEMAYGSVLGRCWMETRKLWLEYITYSTTSILRRTTNVFFRDEYQEDSGNLPHIHGLVGLCKKDMDNEEFHSFVSGLQKSAVCDLFETSKITDFVEKGLFQSERDWFTLTAKAEEVLSHRCSKRCQKRIGEGEGPENFVCRKVHSVLGKIDPLEDEMLPFQYEYSKECLEVLNKAGLWDPPTAGAPNGTFRHDLLVPKRHMGALHPAATCNMSPCIPEWFAFSKSMQNVQILTGTTGVARYVVKYVVKLDDGNRCTVWADKHSGAIMRAEKKFLHNTKVGTSKLNEDKAHEKSKGSKHSQGRAIAYCEMQQQLLGYPEVMTNLNFERISTKPFEFRSSTRMKLDDRGNLQGVNASNTNRTGQTGNDVQEARSPSFKTREKKTFPIDRQMSYNQCLLYGNNIKSGAYDKVTQFGLRPVELVQLVPLLGRYYRWFWISKKRLEIDAMENILDMDIKKCRWIDGLGRQVLLRRGAFGEIREHLQTINTTNMHVHSIELKCHILSMIEANSCDKDFIFDDGKMHLPIPIYSSVTPNMGTQYILHMMLILGSFETELDFRMQPTLRDSLAASGLIGRNFGDPSSSEDYVNRLVEMSLRRVLSLQPISLRKLDEYIVTSRLLFESIIMRNEIPATDLPECILTRLRDDKNEKLCGFWTVKRQDQLRTIYKTLHENMDLPVMEDVVNVVGNCLDWDGLESFRQYGRQSEQSYIEQRAAVKVGLGSLRNYNVQFGAGTSRFTKSVIVHGGPGTGKSHVTLYLSLCAMAMGLKVMTTAIMGVRANALGGIHIHRLFAIPAKQRGNPYRLAEIAMDKLDRKSQLEHLHVLLTMDVLVIDELGQMSAGQLTTIDIILRRLRKSNSPFGGVVILASMDHTQIGAIGGWPVLLSSHISSSFTLIKLTESVRAFGENEFQEFQRITRMSATSLRCNDEVRRRFRDLTRRLFTYVPSWDHPDIGPHVIRMYSRRMPAYGATMEYVSSLETRFKQDHTEYAMSVAKNYQSPVGVRAEPSTNVSDDMMNALNHGLREPEKLIFFRGAQFEATMNGDGYSQSQLMIMLDVPSVDDVQMGTPISLMAAPPKVTQVNLTNGVPSMDELVDNGWISVRIGHARQQSVTVRGMSGYRIQYALKHVGSGTINSQQGRTIEGKCAVECTKLCSPFCKEQVVVAFSRSCFPRDTIVVGDVNFVMDRLWTLITTSNQWTEFIEVLLNSLSINGDQTSDPCPTLHLADRLPYRTCDIELPTDATGYVYMLVSVRDFDRDYIGQCENISRRLDEHNRGVGSLGTASAHYRPYFPAAYICGLSHLDRQMREHLESRWKALNLQIIQSGCSDIMARIEQGRTVVSEYNERQCELSYHIRFVVTIKSDVAMLSEADIQRDYA